MFTPVKKNIFAWRTQDPEYDWEMVGHLLIRNGKLLLIDPPYIHGLEKAVKFMGEPEAIVITTADHTRGSRYLSHKLHIPLYVPVQNDSTSVSPKQIYKEKGIVNYEIYDEGSLLWLTSKRVKVFRGKDDKLPYMDEMILMDDEGSIITGDIVMGSPTGEVLTSNEGFTDTPDSSKVRASYEALRDSLKGLSQINLLSSHGTDIVGNLHKKMLEKKF